MPQWAGLTGMGLGGRGRPGGASEAVALPGGYAGGGAEDAADEIVEGGQHDVGEAVGPGGTGFRHPK